MTQNDSTYSNLEQEISLLRNTVVELRHNDDLLTERIEGRMQIAEHTNIFLDIVFILLSVVLWIVTMSGWRNQTEIRKDRARFREEHEKTAAEVEKYKIVLKEDREAFKREYDKLVNDAMRDIMLSKHRIDEEYAVMKKEHGQMLKDIKGTSEYYLELVAISHEPDLQDRVFEYERILKKAKSFDLTSDEIARVYYYLSITLLEIATKGSASTRVVNESLKKASRYIQKAIELGGKVGPYFYEKAKIELTQYKIYILQTNDFSDFIQKIHEIDQYFEAAVKIGDAEFYMFEEIVLSLRDIADKVTNKESDRRVVYEMVVSWCESSKNFDLDRYNDSLLEIRDGIDAKLHTQNKKLDVSKQKK